MSWRSRIERQANQLWYGRHPSLLWRSLAALNRTTGGRRFSRPSARPLLPVIVVGNLCVGGGGKTPVVEALARHLLPRYSVAVISRGYGGRPTSRPMRVWPDSAPDQAGDEAVLLARQLGDVPVWVDARRDRAVAAALASGSVDVLLSDDGLQHQALARSFEICLIDGQRGFGNGELLPAGPLRAPVSRLQQVDQVLIKGQGFSWPGGEHFELEPQGFRRLGAESDRAAMTALSDWQGRAVTALCGIANPDQFRASLEACGLRVDLRAVPDHHRFEPSDFAGMTGPLVITAKDAVKIEGLALDPNLDIHVLEVKAALPASLLQALDQHIECYQP